MELLIVLAISLGTLPLIALLVKGYNWISNRSKYEFVKVFVEEYFIKDTCNEIVQGIKFDYIDDTYYENNKEFTITSRLETKEFLYLVIMRAVLTLKWHRKTKEQQIEFLNYLCYIDGFKELVKEADIELATSKLNSKEERDKELFIRSGMAWMRSNFEIDESLVFKNFWDFKYFKE